MRDNIKVPEIASTIAPPRHVMASVERGKLGRREKIALAGLACLDRAFIGAPICSGDWQAAQARNVRNAFSGELPAPSPESPYSVDVLASSDRALCSDGTVRRVITHDERVKVVRTLADGDAPIPTPQLAEKAAPVMNTAAPMRDIVAAPARVVAEVDLVEEYLRNAGVKGTITARMRSLALDALAIRAQDAAYMGR